MEGLTVWDSDRWQMADTPPESFPALLERLWKDKHTGRVVLHFAEGCPSIVEFPQKPIRVQLEKR